jgi:hypothetical protein
MREVLLKGGGDGYAWEEGACMVQHQYHCVQALRAYEVRRVSAALT